MVVEINHHWVTFKLPGTDVEFRARYSEGKAGSKKFEVQRKSKSNGGRWAGAFNRAVGVAKAK